MLTQNYNYYYNYNFIQNKYIKWVSYLKVVKMDCGRWCSDDSWSVEEGFVL